MPDRLSATFEKLRATNQKAFVAYVAAGDPDFDHSLEIMKTLADLGSDIIELGLPFSDPLADGIVNQLAADRALKSGMSTPRVLDLIRRATKIMQVVVTTHSPELLDARWITDDNLRIVSWQKGASHLLPPSEATRQAMRQHLMGAGELLRSNALQADELFTHTDDLHNGHLFESLA